MINDEITAYNSLSVALKLKGFFLIKENKGVIFEIALISTSQRPVFFHCSERFQTILII